MQKLQVLSSFSETVQTSADFQKGVKDGTESYEEDRYDGHTVQNVHDVWTFLEQEISPRIVENEGYCNFALNAHDPSLAERVGFLVGYLTSAFAPSSLVSEVRSLPPRRYDMAGFPLDM